MDELVSIVLFGGKECANCKIVLKALENLIRTSKQARLQTLDLADNVSMADQYGISSIPVVLYNGKIVLNSNEAKELIGGDMQSFFGQQEDVAEQTFPGFGQTFSGGVSQELFSHLFNKLIDAGIDASEGDPWGKYALVKVTEKIITDPPTATTREFIGDYVHIGVLQLIVSSILSINPASKLYLHKAGNLCGKYGRAQYELLRDNPRILLKHHTKDKFKELLRGFQRYYSKRKDKPHLFLASKAQSKLINQRRARIRIFDSAFASGMNIHIPVCHLIAGEIEGLTETILGEENVQVTETKCSAMGHPYCEFDILLDGKIPTEEVLGTQELLSEKSRKRFQENLDLISENMYESSLIKRVLRESGDYVHMSILQHSIIGIKFSDPFYSTLLYYAGSYYGTHGADFTILEKIAKDKDVLEDLPFEESVDLLRKYFNNPSTILSRMQGSCETEIIDDETAIIRIYECAMCSGLHLLTDDTPHLPGMKEDEKIFLCDFTAGLIDGRLSRLTGEEINIEEKKCHSLGDPYCEFHIKMV